MYGPDFERDARDESEAAYQATLPVALLPARCPKFQVGDKAVSIFGSSEDTRQVTAMRFDVAYPAQWWFKLETRWYPEGNVWSLEQCHTYHIERSKHRINAHESYAERQARWDADRAELEAEYRKIDAGYGRRGMKLS